MSKEAWLDPIRDRLADRDVASFVDVPLLRHGKLHGRPLVQLRSDSHLERVRGVAPRRRRGPARDRPGERRGARRARAVGARPAQPRRDPRCDQHLGGALPGAAELRRSGRRADARARSGHRRERSVRLRERRARRRCAVFDSARRLGRGELADHDRRPEAGPPCTGPALPALGGASRAGRCPREQHPRSSRRRARAARARRLALGPGRTDLRRRPLVGFRRPGRLRARARLERRRDRCDSRRRGADRWPR